MRWGSQELITFANAVNELGAGGEGGDNVWFLEYHRVELLAIAQRVGRMPRTFCVRRRVAQTSIAVELPCSRTVAYLMPGDELQKAGLSECYRSRHRGSERLSATRLQLGNSVLSSELGEASGDPQPTQLFCRT